VKSGVGTLKEIPSVRTIAERRIVRPYLTASVVRIGTAGNISRLYIYKEGKTVKGIKQLMVAATPFTSYKLKAATY
jgi:hypothetical protein